MKAIIAAETKRAESLIEGFMGLPPETVDLATFNAAVLKQAPKEFVKAVEAIQRISEKAAPSQNDAAFAVNVVDLMAEYAQRPKMSPAIEPLWKAEHLVRESGLGWTLRHLLAVALSFGGLIAGASQDMSMNAQAYAYLALIFAVGSGALHLTHGRDPEVKVPLFVVGSLIGFCLLTAKFSAAVGFLALLAVSVIFMLSSLIGLMSGATNKSSIYEPQMPQQVEYNHYVITEGNEMSEPMRQLK